MAEPQDIEVVPNGERWAVQQQTTRHVFGEYESKAIAEVVAIAFGKYFGVEVLSKLQDGTIGWRNTYTGHDPRDVPG